MIHVTITQTVEYFGSFTRSEIVERLVDEGRNLEDLRGLTDDEIAGIVVDEWHNHSFFAEALYDSIESQSTVVDEEFDARHTRGW